MADDIDIEEHDVFDNPVIRSIFPDISVIKKEISQYYEYVPDIKQEPEVAPNHKEPATDQTRPSVAIECKKNIKATVRAPYSLPDTEKKSNLDNTHNPKTQETVKTNKIILGSKPNYTNRLRHTENREDDVNRKQTLVTRVPKVLLQDLGAYIFRNNRYCKDCRTLYPSRTDFDDHKRKVHSIITRNKKLTVKVTLEKNINKCTICSAVFTLSSNLSRHYKNVHLNQSKRHKCNICGSHFSSSSNLSRHYKNVHNRNVCFKSKYKKQKKDIAYATTTSGVAALKKITRSHRNVASRNVNSEANNLCFHCKLSFPDKKTLIEHIYKVLEPKRYSKEKVREKVILNKNEYVTTNDPFIKKQTNKNVDENHRIQALDTNDQSHLNNQDLVTTRSQSLAVKNKNENMNTETNIQKKNVNESDLLQKKQKGIDTKIINEKQVYDSCSSKTLRSKRRHDDLDACAKVTRALTKRSNENKLTIDLKSSKQIRQQENRDLNLCGSKSLDTLVKKKLNLDLPQTNTVNKKQRLDKESILIGSNIDTIVEELQSNDKDDADNLESTYVYECIYCSYVVPSAKAYNTHIFVKHKKIEKTSRVRKVKYEEQCKYCPSKSNKPASRNKHLYTYHYDIVHKQLSIESSGLEDKDQKSTKFKNPAFKMFQSFVLESIIYKCNKCDVHFLSSYIAKNHEKHMEMLINWKCSICRRIFKKHDKYLHLKQHQFSKTLNVCQFNEFELSRLLYNCTKCAIHFTEDRYLQHFSKCDVETTDSVYCKSCDILIDKLGYKIHETQHGTGSNTSDFTFIAANIITETKSEKVEVVKKRTRLYEQVNCLTFCQACKSYLTDIGLTRKTHIESRCSEIIKHVCNLCGLILTNCALRTHRKHHKKKGNLNIQDFKFFNLQGIQIMPPIPEYPRCKICEIYFVSKNAVISHICSETEYKTCTACNIKLSENAFKLHMNYHNYIMPNAKDISRASVTPQSIDKKNELDSQTIINSKTNTLESKHNIYCDKLKTNHVVYSCQSCKISVDAYDKVIEHCQNHYSPKPKIYSTLKICSKCSLKFERDAYEDHKQVHLNSDIGTFLMFDPAYFISENDIWIQHLFASVPQSVQNEIVGASIYKHECRIKMEVLQKGPYYLTVYKCDRCGNFIDPDCLFAHVKYACPKNVRKHPCTICGLPFMSPVFRNKHEKIHRCYESIRIKSYNIVLINCEKHKTYNTSIFTALEQYVLFQCRTCDGIVDKFQRNDHKCNVDKLLECSICKLLLYKDDYDSHISKHNDLAKFNKAYIKVVLFGNKDNSIQKKIQSLSFSRKISDYTLFKCAICEVCVNNKSFVDEHVCTFDDSKWKCSKCGFYICTKSTLEGHIKQHDTDMEFKIENIQIIEFNLTRNSANKPLDETKEVTHTFEEKNDETKELQHKFKASCGTGEPAPDRDETNADEESNGIISSDPKNLDVEEPDSVALYKCTCGLHYIEKLNAKKHASNCNPKVKNVKQNCSKCSLLFNPKELFSHLLAHHGDKNKTFKYEIIEIDAENDNTEVLTAC